MRAKVDVFQVTSKEMNYRNVCGLPCSARMTFSSGKALRGNFMTFTSLKTHIKR